MSRCFRWRCAPVIGDIITNFTLSNNTFYLFTIYLSILQCINYNHIAIVFPPLPLLDTHNRLFRRPSAVYNSVNPGSFSKWRPTKDVKYRRRTRVQISTLEAFAKKNFVTLFRDGFRDYFRHAYKLHTSLRQLSTRTHGRVYYNRSRPRLRSDPGCARNNLTPDMRDLNNVASV